MATFNGYFEPEVGFNVSPSTVRTPAGSVISFTFEHLLGIGSMTVSGFSSTMWSDTSTMTVAHGQTLNRTMKSGLADGVQDSLTFNFSGNLDTGTVIVEALTADVYPYDFGWEQLVIAGSLQTSEYVTINWSGGLTGTGITVYGHASAQVMVERIGTWGVSFAPIFQGDRVRVRANAPTTFSSTRTIYTLAGSNNERGDYRISTEPDPDSGETLYIGVTVPPISSVDIENLFGSPRLDLWGPPGDMVFSDYVKGGSRVPDITANANIPTSFPMDGLQFLNSATSLYWYIRPADYIDSCNTQPAGCNLSFQWQLGTQFDVGYGDRMKNVVQVRYSHDPDDTGYPGGATVESEAGFDVWLDAQSNRWFRVSATTNSPTEIFFAGTFTIEIRHKDFTGLVITDTCRYELQFFGV